MYRRKSKLFKINSELVNITKSISRHTIIEGQIQNPFKLLQYNYGISTNESSVTINKLGLYVYYYANIK